MPIGIIKIKGADGTVHSVPALKGDASMWYTGTAVTGTGTGIAATVTGSKQYDMYLNTTTKRVYQATNANIWDYKFTNVSHYDARFVIGNTSAGYTADQCDYLCDGTDDQVEINAAIAALPATGGKIVLLDGAYNITANITDNGKAPTELCGTEAARLTFTVGAKIAFYQANCSIHDLTLIGVSTTEAQDVVYTQSDNIHIYNLHIIKGTIHCYAASNTRITNNKIDNINSVCWGIYVYGNHGIIISGNHISDAYYGINIFGGSRANIVNNVIINARYRSVYFDSCEDVVVTDNNLVNNFGTNTDDYCTIHCKTCFQMLFNGNNITVTQSSTGIFHCIIFDNCDRSMLHNNKIKSNSTTTPVTLTNSCHRISCANNAVLSYATGSIDSTGSDNISIVNTVAWSYTG